ncbi:hypothetical protein M409DRAFT_28175 [Zasmidium cellare ATCC 36951]|uniref:Small ribosomal subunit protein uS4m n=1 Tax=Zasmidium cellare ATCC 36951 TaxID=1080233 RepID=A0A6A6C363_ZASCE|nr:uncharacterized protein M409DRAFT_28175 [Zasmidium cellare ATCC 36951]KAF2161445.1 hypothetical protein M409DRAFT_28175 [Zasmidium cellare ATCC 36951]
MPRTKKIHALKRPKLRQSWSKFNLYNLSRVTTPPAANKTFFQQKWLAKSMLRSYHNPDVREGTWTRMFDRRLPAVVPMDHRYLAKYDGSEMASGRGMGVDKRPQKDARGNEVRGPEKTPYMHMTFHPLERRLDTAIFRALFASSTREARQFVVHGWVKVNGKKMIYPGYQLNPGDMFQVDPERVLYATGARKIKKDRAESSQELRRKAEEKAAKKEKAEEDRAVGAAVEEEADDGKVEITAEEEDSATDSGKAYSKELKALLKRATNILDDSKRDLSGKRQQELRNFRKDVKSTFSKLRGMEESDLQETTETFETALAEILTKVPTDVDLPKNEQRAAAESPSTEPLPSNPQLQNKPTLDIHRARKDAELLQAALERARANPVDTSKPYATPWTPRDYMSAFAFIPRYLEVNQNICSAVYLRHPVARPGLAEVPTPFHAETMALGFNWYLRRR